MILMRKGEHVLERKANWSKARDHILLNRKVTTF